MITDLPKDAAFTELTSLVKNGKIVVFAGSGLSSRYHPDDLSGYPAWWELVRDLCVECKVQCDIGEINRSTQPVRLQELAGLAKTSKSGYTAVLERHFAKTIVDRRESYDLLMHIDFQAYVTTNFDPLLAQAATKAPTPKAIRAYPRIKCGDLDLQRVIYLHGYVAENGTPQPDELVLAKEDFQFAYGNDTGGPLRLFWEPFLNDYNILFLGCELGEPELSLCFERCNSIRKSMIKRFGMAPRKRFILLPEPVAPTFDSTVPEKDRLEAMSKSKDTIKRLTDFEVIPVMFAVGDRRHVGLIDILKAWAPPPPTPRFD